MKKVMARNGGYMWKDGRRDWYHGMWLVMMEMEMCAQETRVIDDRRNDNIDRACGYLGTGYDN